MLLHKTPVSEGMLDKTISDGSYLGGVLLQFTMLNIVGTGAIFSARLEMITYSCMTDSLSFCSS